MLHICRVCKRAGYVADLLACTQCGKRGVYHKWCWKEWDEHEPGSTCEKVEMSEHVWISWLLYSNISRYKQKSLHRKDIWATWFGVPHYQYQACLYTYPRLETLLKTSNQDPPAVQYPSIVSFFGDTGAGKSRLIMALIRNTGVHGHNFAVPVPGNKADEEKSTSGDVHMYADPRTLSTKVPLFFVGEYS